MSESATQSTPKTDSPFTVDTALPFVALMGPRAGYIQLAPSQFAGSYTAVDPKIFQAAADWAKIVESFGAKKVLWISLSEVEPHFHIHLYPRWEEDEPKGLDLFNARMDEAHHPIWNADLLEAISKWAQQWNVHPIPPLAGNMAPGSALVEGSPQPYFC